MQRGKERIDALARVIRAWKQRQREDRGHGGHRGSRAKAARAEGLDRPVVRPVAELELPDTDPVDALLTVDPEVVEEALGERRHLGDREAGKLRGRRRHAVRAILADV